MKRLGLIPLVALPLAAVVPFLEKSAAAGYVSSVYIAVSAVIAISCFLTVSKFSPSDRLFVAWALYGSSFLLVIVTRSAALYTTITGKTILSPGAFTVLFLAQNVLFTLPLIAYVQAWRTTGLGFVGSRTSRLLWNFAGIVVAVVVGGFPLARGIATASTDSALLISTFFDVVGLALIVPLLATALTLRGGSLMYTWMFLAASEFGWLLFDLWLALETTLPREHPAILPVKVALRVAAVLFILSASIAQRRGLDS